MQVLSSWLTLWLTNLKAKVVGISNQKLKLSNFNILKLKNNVKDYNIDIRDFKKLKKIIITTKPDYIFHLAAQALVKESFEKPLKHSQLTQ